MNILRKCLSLLAFLPLVNAAMAQQDPQFNLGFVNFAYINPGYAGSNPDGLFGATALNRIELRGFDGAPVSTVVSVEGPVSFFGIESGVGLTLNNSSIGYLYAPGMSLSYAYRRKIGDGSLGIGFSAGFISSWFSETSWRLPDGTNSDPVTPAQKESSASFDAGVGAFYSHPRWYAGVSCTHLPSPKLGIEGFARMSPTLYANGGYTFLMDGSRDSWAIRPMMNVISDFAATSVSVAGTVWYQEKYWAGVSYRWDQAIVGMIGIDIFDGLKIAYAFDYATSELNNVSNGTHEIMLSYSFSFIIPRGTQKYKSIRYL